MSEGKVFTLRFGIASPSLKKQIKDMGYSCDDQKIAQFEKRREAIICLRIGDLLADSVCDKITQKLFKQVQAHVEQHNNLIPVK